MSTKSTILFVDDEPFVLDALKRVFQDQGYVPLFANSGQEAVSIMEQREVHLIVSDFRMPKMDGCQLFQIISERWPDTIRIILSGFADIKAVVSAINEGQIYKFVSKPWNNAELCDIVKSGVEKYWQLSEIKSLAEVAAAQNDILLSDHLVSVERLNRRHFDLESRADLTEAYQLAFRTIASPTFIFREGVLLDANIAAKSLLCDYESNSDDQSDHPLIKELTSYLAMLETSLSIEACAVPVHLASGLVAKAEFVAQHDAIQRVNIVARIRLET